MARKIATTRAHNCASITPKPATIATTPSPMWVQPQTVNLTGIRSSSLATRKYASSNSATTPISTWNSPTRSISEAAKKIHPTQARE
jgi:hypothetical protein